MAFPVSDLYRQAIRNGLTVAYTVDATLNGSPVVGAQGLCPTGGGITDTTKPGVRRVLNLQLAPAPGLFDALSPVGTRLTVAAHVQFTDRSTVDIPMGQFVVDSEKLSEGGAGLSLTAPDKWSIIQRARFIQPMSSLYGTVADQIAHLIRQALGASEPVNVTATSTALVGALTWEKDRDKAIIDMAASIGAWVYFDRYGVATIADIPTSGASADWLVDASANGVMTELDRERSRTSTSNIVVVSSSSTDAPFATQIVWDADVNSPTYAGPNPVTNPEATSPFGAVPYYHDTPLPLGNEGARRAGLAILSRVTGLASTVSLGQVPNPAVDAFDVLDVLPPAERVTTVTLKTVASTESLYPSDSLYPSAALRPSGGSQVAVLNRGTTGAILERHIADTITHPLTVGTAQTIEGRSTRTDEYT